jgi:rod shape determining protein RodA
VPKKVYKINYQLHDRFDLLLFFSVFFLTIFGLMAVYSSTINNPSVQGNFLRQLAAAVLSIIVFFIVYYINPRTFHLASIPSYVLGLLLLVAVLVIGKKVYGARSWLNLGPIGFQPSEFAKVGMILFLANFLSRTKSDIESIADIALGLGIGFLPIALILVEPDMGTAIVFGLIILSMLFWRGISLFGLFVVLTPAIVIFASMFGDIVFIGVLVLVIAALFYFKKNMIISGTILIVNICSGFLFDFVYEVLSPHQQRRISTFLDPSSDPLGSGYNAIQAKVAIGSGGLLGKGFLHGNQTQLRYIPEQWTDFIFCVIGEEFGFIGSIIIVALFLVMFIRLLKIACLVKEKDPFSSLVVIGMLTLLFVHFAINIGMDVGITPVIGLPLPFLSYGGSSLLVNMTSIAIVANIYRNHKQYA